MKEKNVGFREDYFFLSNMYPCKIKYKGYTYRNSEVFYISMKFDEDEKRFICEEETNLRNYFANMKDGKFRKKEQKKYKIRKDWDKVKLDIMTLIIREKFKIPFLRKKLLDTNDEELIEYNSWGDTFWGVCDGKGGNNLGKILMQVRNEIKLETKLQKNLSNDNGLSF